MWVNLPCPDATDGAHDYAGNNENAQHHDNDLDHSSVPLMVPSVSAMTMAVMNMPVSMSARCIQICMCLMLFFI